MKKVMLLIILLFILSGNQMPADSIQENRIRSVDLYNLISRLDLTRPELEQVRRSYGNPSITVTELVNFYRTRYSVKHPVDKKYAEEWCLQLLEWIKKSPGDDQYDYAWRSVDAGMRAKSWTGLYQYFIESSHFSVEVLVAFLNSCYDHASRLMDSGTNYSQEEAEGLASIAATFPEFKDSEKWKQEAFRRLNAGK